MILASKFSMPLHYLKCNDVNYEGLQDKQTISILVMMDIVYFVAWIMIKLEYLMTEMASIISTPIVLCAFY